MLAYYTLPTAEILSGKNAQAWVSIGSYFKKTNKDIKEKHNPESRLGFAC